MSLCASHRRTPASSRMRMPKRAKVVAWRKGETSRRGSPDSGELGAVSPLVLGGKKDGWRLRLRSQCIDRS